MEARLSLQAQIEREHPAVVLGMFDTGLGVGRSLGRNGIKVFGFDMVKNIGFYSKFIKAEICPSPLNEEDEFIDFLFDFGRKQKRKPVLLIAADYFLNSISKNRTLLKEHFLFNIPDHYIIETVSDKFKQTQLAADAGILVPKTYFPENLNEACRVAENISYPAFIKGQNVNQWRVKLSNKGFVVESKDEFIAHYEKIFRNELKAIAQEVIPGPDTNHFKVCSYISKEGEILLAFTLQKIRQKPVRFGVGSCVKSIHFPELLDTGIRLFKNIDYTGVGSAEFKVNERDGKLYLIELNQRYWQQNSLSEKCGMNFPLYDYLHVTGQNPAPSSRFLENIKWVSIYIDWSSYREYGKKRELSFPEWIKSLKGPKVFSDIARDDWKPGQHRFRLNVKRRLVKVKNGFVKYTEEGQTRKDKRITQKAPLFRS
jgi:D-aspartate ligase